MRWGVLLIAMTIWFGCAHSKSAECSQESGHSTNVTAEPQSSLLQKFDPGLRWSLRDKTAGAIVALAELSSPFSEAELTSLAESGLKILRADESRLHVEGDAPALLRLAGFAKVTRIQASRPMRPSPNTE